MECHTATPCQSVASLGQLVSSPKVALIEPVPFPLQQLPAVQHVPAGDSPGGSSKLAEAWPEVRPSPCSMGPRDWELASTALPPSPQQYASAPHPPQAEEHPARLQLPCDHCLELSRAKLSIDPRCSRAAADLTSGNGSYAAHLCCRHSAAETWSDGHHFAAGD